ncbi:MAG TPA: hypothetical protein VMH82_08255 [Myxococcota bacterium]|nr:hypothetical protein [Myxococcota bacterium]
MARAATSRNRLLTASVVASFVIVTRTLFPDPQIRAANQYLFVITLGYGHLIGAAVFSRRRLAGLVPAGVPPRLFWAFVGVSIANLFALYAWLSNVSTLFFFPLLGVSLWHIVENDLALAGPSRNHLALGALPRSLEGHLLSLGITALVLAVGQSILTPADYGPVLAGSPLIRLGDAPARFAAAGCGLVIAATGNRRGIGIALAGASLLLPADSLRALSFGDFFSAVTLYHLVQFLLLFAGRARETADTAARRRLLRDLASVHLPPAALCIALLLGPGARFAALRYAIFSPAIYLFWSVLHVGQTLATRGVERQPARAAEPVGV